LGRLTSLDCSKTDEDIINDILVPVKDNVNEQTCENESECSDDINSDCSEGDYASDAEDESGWITPQNIAHKKQEVNSEVDDATVKVACITSDFAMQVRQIIFVIAPTIFCILYTYVFRLLNL
jgi:rRNA maturation endonuclease Nob1